MDLERVDTVLLIHLRDLLVEPTAPSPIRRLSARANHFTVRDLTINLDSPSTKIVDDDGLIVEEIATHRGGLPPFLQGRGGGFLWRHGCIRVADSYAVGEECGLGDL